VTSLGGRSIIKKKRPELVFLMIQSLLMLQV